jgi:uncharacterized protein YukE
MSTSDPEKLDDQAAERGIGMGEQKTIESQEAQTEVKDVSTTTPVEMVNEILESRKEGEKTKPKQKPKSKAEDTSRKLFGQFTKHFQVSKVASDKTTNILKQIQKRLAQIDRTTAVSNKQQVVIKQLASQVKTIQKQLDKISSSINQIRTVTNTKRKAGNSKRKRK